MRKTLTALFVFLFYFGKAQNVGIGTNAPETPLHILVNNAIATLRVQTAGTGAGSSIELKTSSTLYDQLELKKWSAAASGTMAGINVSNLSTITAGAGAQGGLLLGTILNYPLYFTTNNTQRMQIDNNGSIGVNMTPLSYKFSVKGDVFVYSAFGSFKLGYPGADLWNFSTTNGGQDLQFLSQSLPDGSDKTTRFYIKQNGNAGFSVDPTDFARLHVRRLVNFAIAPLTEMGALYAENGSDIDGSGVVGATAAPRSGSAGNAGVSGQNVSTGTDRFGVIGQSSGTSSGSALSAGVGGYGDNGVLGWSQSTTGAGVVAQHGSGKTALEVNNGFIKVSGTNKSAFKHTTAAANITGNITVLTYDSPSPNDILIVTHNYSPTNTYHNKTVGVYWTGSKWSIYNEDLSVMPANIVFNVLVIRQ